MSRTLAVTMLAPGWIIGLIFIGCSTNEPSQGKPETPATASTPAGAPANESAAGNSSAPQVTNAGGAETMKGAAGLTPEMKDFLSHMDGDVDHVDAAREKYAAEGADLSDFPSTPLREPRLEGSELRDGKTCYKVKFKSGQVILTLEICWKDERIVEVKQLDYRIE